MSVCGVCGSTDFGDPHDGLFFCLECGTQSQVVWSRRSDPSQPSRHHFLCLQDAREEVSQLEEGGGDRYIRRLKAKKGKPSGSKKHADFCDFSTLK